MSYKSTKKWRKKHPHQWQATKRRYYNQFEAAANNKHQRWTVNDVALVIQKKESDRTIAKLIGRSVKAIQIKRLRMKEMTT